MSLNSLKKMVIFSSQTNRTIVEKYVEDIAEVQRRSASGVIENILLGAIVTGHGEVDFWIKGLYCDDYTIETVLQAIFEWVEAGTNNEPKYDNLLPVLEYAIKQNHFRNPIINGDEEILPHLFSQLESLAEKLEYEASNKDDLIESGVLKKEAEWMRKMCDNAMKCPEGIKISSFFYAIKKNWDVLKNFYITYRTLADLISLCKGWRNDASARLELIEILRKISGEWTDA